MNIFSRTLFLAVLLVPTLAVAQVEIRREEPERPGLVIKTNLVQDATASMNVAVELRTGDHTSVELPITWNPFVFKNNHQWRHFLVQPEFRYWLRETFDGHFFGGHAHYAYYNVGALPHGPFSRYMAGNRFQGWLAGVGVSYGYRWNFNHWLGLEATIGVGYAYLDYDRYECIECGNRLGSDTKHVFTPTRIGVSLVFGIGKKKTEQPLPPVEIYREPTVVPAPEPEPVVPIVEPTPEPEEVIVHESGQAYLDFQVGRDQIMPSHMNNAAELGRIRTQLEPILHNPAIKIQRIEIIGHASPEGSSTSNQALSWRRAQQMMHYLSETYDLPLELFDVTGAGEDWDGLTELVEKSDMPRRSDIVDAIRQTSAFDQRDGAIRDIDGGASWQRMREEFFPLLRRIDYKIDYTVATSAKE